MVNPSVISLFAGCGGSSLGYKWAGFIEVLAIDFDKNSVETFALNFPEVPVWQKDICKVTAEEILQFCKIKKGELDVLDGSPPCQGFSTAGKRNVNDSRNDLFKEYCRILKELQPKVFVMENVSGMVKGKMKGIFLEILAELKSCGYNIKCKLMNAMWYDVPQSRERLIFIGFRNDLNIEPVFPEPKRKFITVKQIFSNLIVDTTEAFSLTPKYMRPVLKQMKDYEIASKYTNGIKYFNHKRNSFKRPSRTILKTPDTYHHSEDRLLTKEELKRLASFPDDFILVGSLKNHYNRIGNSVPPKMMQAIAETVKKQLQNVANCHT